jgi:hypothetical protein
MAAGLLVFELEGGEIFSCRIELRRGFLMGLDLVVEGCPKAGYEAEWRQILERSFAGEEPLPTDVARFNEITIPPHERVGAPRVGYDSAADEWIIKARNAATPDEVANTLREFYGYYALPLVKCDGLPNFTHSLLYEGVDETSFRGAFLSDCYDVLAKDLIDEAWDHKFPDEAIAYGKVLVAAANAAKPNNSKAGLFSLFGSKKKSDLSFEEQLEIVRAAGKWFIFWGERGHAIRAWF